MHTHTFQNTYIHTYIACDVGEGDNGEEKESANRAKMDFIRMEEQPAIIVEIIQIRTEK